MAPRGVVRIGHRAGTGAALGCPLLRAGGAACQLPLVAEQRLEVAMVPADRIRRPRAFEAAGGRMHAMAAAEAILPAETLFLDGSGLRLAPHQAGVARAVRLAESVAAGDQRHGLLVVHRHAGEGLANV